jgi:hypothetical protein
VSLPGMLIRRKWFSESHLDGRAHKNQLNRAVAQWEGSRKCRRRENGQDNNMLPGVGSIATRHAV